MQLSPTDLQVVPDYLRGASEFGTRAKKMALNELAKYFRPGQQKVSNSDISKE